MDRNQNLRGEAPPPSRTGPKAQKRWAAYGPKSNLRGEAPPPSPTGPKAQKSPARQGGGWATSIFFVTFLLFGVIASAAGREVAITIDDLPRGGDGGPRDLA